MKTSLKKYLYTQLEYYLENKRWLFADETTHKLMLTITKKDKDGYLDKLDGTVPLDIDSINNYFCPDLQKIDNLWVKYSKGRFGFSVQKKIFLETGNKLDRGNKSDYAEPVYQNFGLLTGWYSKERDQQTGGNGWLNRRDQELIYRDDAPEGHLPGNGSFWLWSGVQGLKEGWKFSARVVGCTYSAEGSTQKSESKPN